MSSVKLTFRHVKEPSYPGYSQDKTGSNTACYFLLDHRFPLVLQLPMILSAGTCSSPADGDGRIVAVRAL